MKKKWILIANRSGAKLFSCQGRGNGLALVQELDHPEGRLQNKDLVSDRAGSSGMGHGAYSKEHLPTDHVQEQFASSLAQMLEDGRNHKHYEELILVAEPHFLGRIRAALKQATASLVIESHSKDLVQLSDKELRTQVHQLLFP